MTPCPCSRPSARRLRAATPCRSRLSLAVLDAVELATARSVSRWRPLLWLWLSILSVAAAGGALLEYLGPPAERLSPDQVRPDPQQAAGAAEPEAVPGGLSSPAAPLPMRPEADDPTPKEARPSADARAPGGVAQANPPPRSRVLAILHPARSEGSRAAAKQLAIRAGLAPDQVDMGAAADARSDAILRFYSAADHALARRLGKELTQMGYPWRIENFSDRPSPPGHQALEVWLPKR